MTDLPPSISRAAELIDQFGYEAYGRMLRAQMQAFREYVDRIRKLEQWKRQPWRVDLLARYLSETGWLVGKVWYLKLRLRHGGMSA